jgi:hypothetical protein
MDFKYLNHISIDEKVLKTRYFLGKYLAKYIVYIIPLFGNRFVFPLLLKTCMMSKKTFCINPYLAKYYFQNKMLISVSVVKITKFMRDWIVVDDSKKHTNDYFLATGDWINITDKIEDMHVFRETNELEKYKWEYKKTKVYTNLINRMQNKNPAKKQHILLDSVEKIDAYFERFKNLHDSMVENGFMAINDFKLNSISNQERNIGIAIDKDGSMIKLPGGQHRFSIALTLGIPKISVEIRMIHKEYLQKVCDAYNLVYIDGVLRILSDLNFESTNESCL